MRLRGAMLGAGNIALRGHLPQWVSDDRLRHAAEIVAVADLVESNRDAARALLPAVRLYPDAADLLGSERLDFCDICTPPFTHRGLIEGAARQGLHARVMRPMRSELGNVRNRLTSRIAATSARSPDGQMSARPSAIKR